MAPQDISGAILPDRKCLIITGMHRSFTSVTAQILHDAGLFIGDQLIGPGKGNWGGHFEQKDIVEFHIHLLEKSGTLKAPFLPYSRSLKKVLRLDLHQKSAKKLIEKHFQKGNFGFKDPRAALFLPIWQAVIPQAKILLLVRHPLACVTSLMQRSEQSGKSQRGLLTIWRYLNLWYLYNQHIRYILESAPASCHVLHVPYDLNDHRMIEHLQNRLVVWGFDLSAMRINAFFDPKLITTQDCATLVRLMYGLHPAKKMYEWILAHRQISD